MKPREILAAFDRYLAERVPWLEQQDLNPDWPAHVCATVADLVRRLGHAV